VCAWPTADRDVIRRAEQMERGRSGGSYLESSSDGGRVREKECSMYLGPPDSDLQSIRGGKSIRISEPARGRKKAERPRIEGNLQKILECVKENVRVN